MIGLRSFIHNGYKMYDKNAERQRRLNRKKKVIDHYGGECECCGIDKIELLSIDHISGGGTKHRKDLKIVVGCGAAFYRHLIRNNFPKDNYQLLCHNCNSYKEYYIRRAAS